MRAAWWLGFLLGALAACAGEPTVSESNASFVTVTRPAHTTKAAVRDLAKRTCGRYEKRAVFLDERCTDSTCTEHAMTFWCQ